MYNFVIETDAGKSISFGADAGVIADIDPLNGIDVDISTSQGFQQVGVTVERSTVHGVTRTISGVFLGSEYQMRTGAEHIIEVLPVFTSGKLTFDDMYFCRFVVSKTPYVVRNSEGKWSFSMQIFCADPFWHTKNDVAVLLNVWSGAFQFPTSFNSHKFGTRSSDKFITVDNIGTADVFYHLRLSCTATTKNYGIMNVETLEYVKVNDTLQVGESVDIYRENNRLRVEKTVGDTVTDIFSKLDEDSKLWKLKPNVTTLILLGGDDGTATGALQGSISFSPAVMGVVDNGLH